MHRYRGSSSGVLAALLLAARLSGADGNDRRRDGAHAADRAAAPGLPRFLGIAYSDVNLSVASTHNIIKMAEVLSEPWTGRMEKHKGWIPADPAKGALQLVSATMAMPAAMQAIKANLYANESTHPADNILPADAPCSGKWPQTKSFSGVWWEHGAAETAKLHAEVVCGFKAAGGQLDVWAVDDESAGSMHSWWIAKGPSDECGRAKWTAIQNDKRFPKLLKLLQDLGFGSPPMNTTDWLATYMTCCGGDINLHHYRAWSAATAYYFSHWIEVGQTTPVRKHFPNVIFSEYSTEVGGGSALSVPTTSGFMGANVSVPPAVDTPTNQRVALPGGTQSPEFYFDLSSGLATTLKHDFGVKQYNLTAFNAARHAVNKLRSNLLGAQALKLQQPVPDGGWNGLTIPYIPYKSYRSSKTNTSDQYQEFILHAGLMGVDRFFMWNTHSIVGDDAAASRSFDELQSVLDYNDEGGTRVWSTQAGSNGSWTDGFMLTATALPDESDPRCIWRFTPNLPAGGSVESFITMHGDGATLSGMVSTDGVGSTASIVIPLAKLLQPKSTSGRGVASKAGVWLTQTILKGDKQCPATVLRGYNVQRQGQELP